MTITGRLITYWIDARIRISLSAFCFSFSDKFAIFTYIDNELGSRVGYLLECVLLAVGGALDFEDLTEGSLAYRVNK